MPEQLFLTASVNFTVKLFWHISHVNLANGNKNKIAYIRDDILEIIYSMFLVFEITYFISKLAQLFENSKKSSRGGEMWYT